mgnify:FL=1|tara:strand:+ start:163 stop:1140 length:978 start_codon:yes stop_codon:yes gene_type:complete
MACGLGAIALILVLVKDDIFDASPMVPTSEIEVVSLELDELIKKNSDKEIELSKLQEDFEKSKKKNTKTQTQILSSNKVIETLKESIKKTEEEIKKIEKDKFKPSKYDEKISGYLSGCNIRGNKVVLLLDNSASMMHKKIVDIIRLSVSGNNLKKSTKKWMQATRAFNWMVEKTPNESSLVMGVYNEDLEIFNKNNSWIRKNNQSEVDLVSSKIFNVVPEKGTNLFKAFEGLRDLGSFDSVFIITDGMPTYGANEPRSCNKTTASPKCRKDLFNQAISYFYKNFPKTSLNIIFLPLEADSTAPFEYSVAAHKTGGCFIAPSKDWP